MDTQLLSTFLAVLRTGSVTRAARQLGLGQPTVTGHLARLEEQLGASLLHRSARGMTPTEAGLLWRDVAVDVLARLGEGRDALHGLAGATRGSLRIGAGATATAVLLPRLLSRYRDHHPGVVITVREQGSAAVVDGLLGDELDVGVVTLPLTRSASHLRLDPWVEDELRLVVPHDHPLRGASHFDWTDLRDQPLVMFEAGAAVRRPIDDAFAAAGVVPQVVMELRSLDAIQHMVTAGIGAGFVSGLALPPGVGLAPRNGALRRQLALARRKDRPPTAATRAFYELALRPFPPRGDRA